MVPCLNKGLWVTLLVCMPFVTHLALALSSQFCNNNVKCFTNAQCNLTSHQCQCNEGYRLGRTRSLCVDPTQTDEWIDCDSDQDCSDFKVCVTNRCQCTEEMKLNPVTNRCYDPRLRLGEPCHSNAQCGDRAQCQASLNRHGNTIKRCLCPMFTYPNFQTGITCLDGKVRLGWPCHRLDDECGNNAVCAQTDDNKYKLCKCREDYVGTNGVDCKSKEEYKPCVTDWQCGTFGKCDYGQCLCPEGYEKSSTGCSSLNTASNAVGSVSSAIAFLIILVVTIYLIRKRRLQLRAQEAKIIRREIITIQSQSIQS